MLTEICADLRNYFATEKRLGEFKISGGSIAPSDFLQDGQYFRIVGSVFNDGVHQFPASDLTDEAFNGAVWAMAVPPNVIALSAEIEQYVKDHPESDLSSESFGGYSYTKVTGSSGSPATWKDVYRSRLNKWRKMR